jgi:hypothetical protein
MYLAYENISAPEQLSVSISLRLKGDYTFILILFKTNCGLNRVYGFSTGVFAVGRKPGSISCIQKYLYLCAFIILNNIIILYVFGFQQVAHFIQPLVE